MSGPFKRLFEPGHIGTMALPNRIAMAPMGTALAELDGRYSRRQIDYFAERARGGTGLIITEAAKVETDIDPALVFPMTRADSDAFIPSMADLVEALHGYGSKVAMQITPGTGRQSNLADPANPPVAPSEVPAFANPAVLCRAITKQEIQTIVEAFGVAAQRANMAGFDAIEIHGHSGYLLDQFMSTRWNLRRDEYGGALEGRLRFALEIIEAVRGRVGKDYPVIFRLSADHYSPGGRGVDESLEIARRLEAAGVDALHIDGGSYEAMDYIFPPYYLGDACLVDLAAAVKQVVGVPVITVGNMTPESAEDALVTGKADFVALGRGLIADPEWPNKVRRDQLEDLRPCIRCNEQCIGRLFSMKTVSCAVNPQAGSERYYPITSTGTPKRVLVVGGGPAGMEAARVAALRGHRVTLMEKKDHLGGLLTLAATPSFKKGLRQMVSWWSTQLRKLGVNVLLNSEVTPDSLARLEADAVVMACGSSALYPDIPGIHGENVVGVLDYHAGSKPVHGPRVVIAGGGLSGCDAAVEMAMEGKNVTIVEMLPNVALDLNAVSRVTLIRMLAQYGVKTLTEHRIKEFRPNGLLAEGPGGAEVLVEGDTMVVALGMQPNRDLADRLREKWDVLHIVGDCVEPSKVGEAVRAGFMAGWHI